jgi:hypothetical protein
MREVCGVGGWVTAQVVDVAKQHHTAPVFSEASAASLS